VWGVVAGSGCEVILDGDYDESCANNAPKPSPQDLALSEGTAETSEILHCIMKYHNSESYKENKFNNVRHVENSSGTMFILCMVI
jgi:hypothetical protein